MLAMEERLYTTAQVAKRLQKSEYTIRKYLNQGTLAGIKVGGKDWRVSEADINRYLDNLRNQQDKK